MARQTLNAGANRPRPLPVNPDRDLPAPPAHAGPESWWPILALIAIGAAWMGWPLLHPRQVGWDSDALFLFYPGAQIARAQLLAGHVPLWNPYKFMGAPLLANMMMPVFYPPDFLGLLLPQPFGLHAAVTMHYPLAAVGAYLLARRGFGISATGAMLSGVTFGLSGPMLAHASHVNQLFAMAWLPYAWLATLLLIQAPSLKTTLWLATALGMQMLSDQPQITFYCFIAMGLSLLFECVRPGSRRARVLTAFACGAILAGGLAAVHWLPALELSRLSYRQDVSLKFASSFSLPWKYLTMLLLPGLHGREIAYTGESDFAETAIFVGQASLLLALVAVTLNFRQRRVALALAVGGAGLLVALGDQTILFRVMLKLIPMTHHFRAPARAFCLTALAIATCAGMGLEIMVNWASRRRGPAFARVLAACFVLLELCSLASFRYGLLDLHFSPIDKLNPTTSPATVIYSVTRRPGRVLRLYEEYWGLSPSEDFTREQLTRFQSDIPALSGLRDVIGHDEGMLPLSHVIPALSFAMHYQGDVNAISLDGVKLGLLGIEFVVSDRPITKCRLEYVGVANGLSVWRNPNYRGEVFTARHWPEIHIAGAAEPRRASPPPPIEWNRLVNGSIDVQFPKGFSGQLLLSEAWAPGWKAVGSGFSVDGSLVDGLLIAFDLPPNTRRVTLEYDPASFRAGLTTSLCSLALMLALGLYARRNPLRRR